MQKSVKTKDPIKLRRIKDLIISNYFENYKLDGSFVEISEKIAELVSMVYFESLDLPERFTKYKQKGNPRLNIFPRALLSDTFIVKASDIRIKLQGSISPGFDLYIYFKHNGLNIEYHDSCFAKISPDDHVEYIEPYLEPRYLSSKFGRILIEVKSNINDFKLLVSFPLGDEPHDSDYALISHKYPEAETKELIKDNKKHKLYATKLYIRYNDQGEDVTLENTFRLEMKDDYGGTNVSFENEIEEKITKANKDKLKPESLLKRFLNTESEMKGVSIESKLKSFVS